MSVNFKAKVIFGFRISQEEFFDLRNRISDDEMYNLQDEGYIQNFNWLNVNPDWFFVAKTIASTEDWVEFNIDSLEANQRMCKFDELFPHRKLETAKLYLVEQVF